ncbi:sodium:proton antiporter [Blastopirellula marina]|uniref:Sodium:proton antiporter n=2 Tax=Blastopirellula marina TaxID=124 RepID=A0A2S8GCD5_9BACT|nr:sodium:proton antiporter [Blastopirellula marina]PTL46317.1 sodium:proton antiporter [Blastopirellula marina]
MRQRIVFFSLLGVILGISAIVGLSVSPTWVVKQYTVDSKSVEETAKVVPAADSGLTPADFEKYRQEGTEPKETKVFIREENADGESIIAQVTASKHYGIWSLFPAVVAITSCWVFREPLTSLLLGTVSGALILQSYNFTPDVLIPSLATTKAATILVLYLWLLGGLLGIWARTGTAQAFAEWTTKHFVRGPRSAKLVAWFLGVLFFQGGTISTVLVGTAVRPISDQERISHEELAYIVDSTASPIAVLIAYNAWPTYIQSLIYVPGIAYLANESERLKFFYSSLPLSFYAIFAVLGTFLLSIDMAPFLGKRFREAIHRSRTTGQLDRPGSEPLAFVEPESHKVAPHYQPHAFDFLLPLLLLTGIAVGSFFIDGKPQVELAFTVALVVAGAIAMIRGMSLHDLMAGVGTGMQSVVFASVILLLAITLGSMTQVIGGGTYLVEQIGSSIPYWGLPAILFAISIGISFSTGTSFGTFAVTFPLAMPLAASLAQSQDLANEPLYLAICFACVLNGSVFGDQCSPISDTTVLSAMTSGADLMDHVLTQIVPASVAAILALVCWTAATLMFC